ncbi:MAG: baseplate J/gp47 family protein [Myxococcota bacterium]
MSGLTATGFIPKRAADFKADFEAKYLAELEARGLPTDVDFTRDVFLGPLSVAISTILGEGEALDQALFDAWNVNNATGILADNLGQIVGVPRNVATNSTATVTLTGESGTFIPQNSLVAGGDVGSPQWRTTADVRLSTTSPFTADVAVEAVEAGEITAAATTITQIITPVSGWTAVSNAVAADPGEPAEDDAAYLLRRVQSLQIRGAGALKAIRAALLDLDYLEAAIVIDNDRDTPQTVGGKLLPAHSIGVVVYPDPATDARRDEIAKTIFSKLAGPAYVSGSDVVRVVTDSAGHQKIIRFDVATDLSVAVAVTVTLELGFTLPEIQVAITAAVTAYFAALAVGSPIYDLDILALCAAVEGVARAGVTLNGANAVVPTITEKAILGSVVVS